MKRLVVLICLTFLALPLHGGSPVLAAPQIETIVTQPSDVPSGFDLLDGQYISNEEYAVTSHYSVAYLNKVGRVTAYDVNFGGDAPNGLCCIGSQATQFTAGKGAEAFYQRLRRDTKKERPLGVPGVEGFLLPFICPCNNRNDQVLIATARKHTFVVVEEVHFSPGSRTNTELRMVVNLLTRSLKRVP